MQHKQIKKDIIKGILNLRNEEDPFRVHFPMDFTSLRKCDSGEICYLLCSSALPDPTSLTINGFDEISAVGSVKRSPLYFLLLFHLWN